MSSWLLRIVVNLVGKTLRWKIDDPSGLLRSTSRQPIIFALWHNRIFLMPYLFDKYWKPRGHTRVAVLVSASKDGEKLAKVLAKFNLDCVRGSTSRRGKRALRELARIVEKGYDVGITPDGPRGPQYRVQHGVISLAQLTQAPIIPISYTLSHKIQFNSWDQFMVPIPFSRCTVRIGVPITVPRDANSELHEQKRIDVENELQLLSKESPLQNQPLLDTVQDQS